MKCLITIWIVGTILPVFPQQIFKTKLQGMAVQRFVSSQPIRGFSVSGPDGEGYVYLIANSDEGSGAILRTRWQGTKVQEFSLPEGSYITGFEASGPDGDGYVYLVAIGSEGERGEILKTKWRGTAVQSYSAPHNQEIRAFNVSGPDAGGYVYLIAATEARVEEEDHRVRIESLRSILEEIIPNPCFRKVKISYSLAQSSEVNIKIYDCSGRFIKRLINEKKKPGRYELVWSGIDDKGRRVSSGVYFVEMDAGKFRAIRKITVMR